MRTGHPVAGPWSRGVDVASRTLTGFWKRNSRLRHIVPPGAAYTALKVRSRATELRRFYLPVAHASQYTNLFHCCVHKSGSQWIMSVLNDPLIYRHSGMSHYHYNRRSRTPDFRSTAETTFDTPFPKNAIVSPLYVTYDNYQAIPSRGPRRAFFVLRDPRDLIVSWYYSARDNHILHRDPHNPLRKAREDLRAVSKREGLEYGIRYWASRGRFDSLRSWHDQGRDDPDVMLVRYEDLTARSVETFRSLFAFLDIAVPAADLTALVESHSFKRQSGRTEGAVNDASHLRMGRAGAWEAEFDAPLLDYLATVSDDLVGALGYDA